MQQFEAPQLEEALQSAIDVLGPGVQVVDARRVRTGGVFGIFARERFVVEAAGTDPADAGAVAAATDAPAPVSAACDVDDVFARMVEAVEAREAAVSAGAADVPAPAPATATPAADRQAPGAEPAPALAAPPTPAAGTVAAIGTDPGARAEAAALPASSPPVAGRPVVPAPPAGPPSMAAAVPAAALGAPRWSMEALAALGVPEAVRSRLDVEACASDLEWAFALERAIAAALPPPAAVSGAAAAMHGTGTAASLDLLAAGVAGFAPGTLLLAGDALVASASELALAVRACLPR